MLDSPPNDDASNGLADRGDLSILPVETCNGCGLCCQGIGSPVAIYASRPGLPDPHPSRPPDLPVELIQEINDHFAGLFRGQEPQDACLWFDRTTLRCRHYEFRPPICREYQLGGSECQRRRAEERTRTGCQ